MLFGAVCAADGSATDALIGVAREFSPRIEMTGPREVTIDLSGLTRLFGDAREVGDKLIRIAAGRGLRVRVVIAGTHTTARLLACAAGGPLTVVDPGAEAAALAPLPIDLLAVLAYDEPVPPSHPRTLGRTVAPSPRRTVAPSHDVVLTTFRRWGLHTLGEVAALPADAVAARLGQEGVRWQRLARGEDPRPLFPAIPEERFEQALDLEWPIEGLEPLSFALGRLLDPLSAQLERRGRGATVLHVRLHLVTRAVHERSLQLPAPMRDARALRTLVLLDLESHPPAAAIDRVVAAVDPTPARVLQFSLLARPLPSPEQISTLMARLTALMGEGRCGAPADVNSWQPGAFAMNRFDREPVAPSAAPSHPHTLAPHTSKAAVALRRFRFPVPARVRVEQGRPVRVITDRVAMCPDDPVLAKRSAFANRGGLSGGAVTQCAGPWRTSGGWWAKGLWDRDEWDVTLGDGATYRVFRDRSAGAWFIEGIVD